MRGIFSILKRENHRILVVLVRNFANAHIPKSVVADLMGCSHIYSKPPKHKILVVSQEKYQAIAMNDYRVTFDRRVEIIEFPLRQNDTGVDEPDEEEDSLRQHDRHHHDHVDDEVFVVRRHFESVQFHEICRDIQDIRKKLRRRSILHQNLVNAAQQHNTSTRKRDIVHFASTDSESITEKDGCHLSPPSMRVKTRKGLLHHASSL